MTREAKVPAVAPAIDASTYDRRSSSRAETFDPISVRIAPRISLVEASAGTGKTFCITLTVLRLLLEPDAAGAHRSLGRILVVTFTNAATDELITRLRGTLRDAVDVFSGRGVESEKTKPLFELRRRFPEGLPLLEEALASLDQLSVFTIHGFCKRVLEISALESDTPFDTTFLEDDAQLVDRAAQDWWRRTIYPDARLAAMAVEREWAWDTWKDDLKSVRRWPNTRIEPDVRLVDALRDLDVAMAAFRQEWDRQAFIELLAPVAWLKEKGLAGEGMVEAAADVGDRLASGDFAGGIRIASTCTSAALVPGMPKRSNADKAAAAALPNVPIIAAIDRLAAAVGRVEQALRVSYLAEVEKEFQKEKDRRHLMGFDDLLRRLCSAITAEGPDGQLAEAIRKRYDAALIDEFQDTDPYQFPIFSTAFAGRPLFLIGDPKQAIYGFRGADIFAYMRAAGQATSRYTLQQNWRSTRRVVEGVNALFSRRANPFLFHDIGFLRVDAARDLDDPLAGTDARAATHWMYVPDSGGKPTAKGAAEEAVRAAFCREIVALVSRGADRPARLRPGSIAILVRSGWEGEAFQKALARLGVPSIISGMGNILKSREMVELERVLRAVLRPQHAPAVRAALATELWGLDARAIHRLSLPEHEAEWQAIVDDLLLTRETWSRHGFMRAAQDLVARLGAVERLLGFIDGERRVTNLRHAVELLHAVALDARYSPEALLAWVARARAANEEEREVTELRLESDADAVQIVTIHKAKGLEYDVVFCPSLLLPRKTAPVDPVAVHESNGAVVFDHGSPLREQRGRLENSERLAEDLRLAYVALTRARFRTYVAWGAAHNSRSGDGAWDSALGYLLRESDGEAGEPAAIAESVASAEAKALSAWPGRLEELVRSAGDGVMSWETIGGADAPSARAELEPGQAAAPVVRTTLPSAAQLDTWRIASFTSLSSSSRTDAERDVADGADAQLVVERPKLARGDFMAFPSGRLAGVSLHGIFERLDFQAAAECRPLVAEVLRKYRFVAHDGDERVDATAGMVARVVGATLPGESFSLADVAGVRTLREWSFHLPLERTDRRALAQAFSTHGDDLARRYAPALRTINPAQTHGFLTGVVDLAFERDGRWFVVDWKSNHLGTDAESYEPEALEAEMFGSHYVLQYHLYVTALHRFLRTRLPGYGYDTHMGGAWYAFLRGIDGSRRGWHAHRPARALVEALDAMMVPAAGSAEATA